jgi:hypothetical protein
MTGRLPYVDCSHSIQGQQNGCVRVRLLSIYAFKYMVGNMWAWVDDPHLTCANHIVALQLVTGGLLAFTRVANLSLALVHHQHLLAPTVPIIN